MTIRKKTKQIGQMLIEKGVLSPAQLAKALEVQNQEGGLIGQVLIKLGYVTKEQIDLSVDEQEESSQQLERILVENNMLTHDQIRQAADIHSQQGGILAEHIVKLGLLKEEDIISLMVTQLGIPYLQLENYLIEPDVIKLIPKDMARKYYLIPIDKIGDILTLAMADPLNPSAVAEVKKLTKLNVESFISSLSDITRAIDHYYAA